MYSGVIEAVSGRAPLEIVGLSTCGVSAESGREQVGSESHVLPLRRSTTSSTVRSSELFAFERSLKKVQPSFTFIRT